MDIDKAFLQDLINGPALIIDNLDHRLDKYLSEQTIERLNVVCKNLVGNDYIVVYHCVNYKKDEDQEACIRYLSKDVQALDDEYELKGSLIKCNEIQLNIQDLSLPRAVFSFVSIPLDKYDNYKDKYLNKPNTTAINQGEIGKNIEELMRYQGD